MAGGDEEDFKLPIRNKLAVRCPLVPFSFQALCIYHHLTFGPSAVVNVGYWVEYRLR